ncbi:hypothetical protein LDENG_00225760 [Lucifuga dentata]|nr:hypothetical protein LDENG_00225760 [Lucifuga dentata]
MNGISLAANSVSLAVNSISLAATPTSAKCLACGGLGLQSVFKFSTIKAQLDSYSPGSFYYLILLMFYNN